MIGAGYIGLEVAGSLRERGLEVAVVAPQQAPLERQLGPEMGSAFRRLHERRGVVFHLGQEVAAIEGDGRVERVRLRSGAVLPAERTHILSTGGMLDQARRTTSAKVLVATEVGMLHQLRLANPTTSFEPVNERASCPYMKMTTPAKILASLQEGRHEVEVDPEIARRARQAVERMVAIGSTGAGE